MRCSGGNAGPRRSIVAAAINCCAIECQPHSSCFEQRTTSLRHRACQCPTYSIIDGSIDFTIAGYCKPYPIRIPQLGERNSRGHLHRTPVHTILRPPNVGSALTRHIPSASVFDFIQIRPSCPSTRPIKSGGNPVIIWHRNLKLHIDHIRIPIHRDSHHKVVCARASWSAAEEPCARIERHAGR